MQGRDGDVKVTRRLTMDEGSALFRLLHQSCHGMVGQVIVAQVRHVHHLLILEEDAREGHAMSESRQQAQHAHVMVHARSS